MRWKYFDPHPFWEGSRSYLLESGSQIAAHGCVVPIRFLTQSGPVTSCCIVDWAADPAFPGAGALLYQRLYRLSETMLGIGGSDAARKVLPRMGFQVRAQLDTFVRVARPWSLFREKRKSDWRSTAHLGRNLARLFRPLAPVPSGWSARRVARFDSSINPVLPRPGPVRGAVCERSPAFLNYILACPVGAMSAFALTNAGELEGYCVLSQLERQCRIADLWIASERAEDWRVAYGLAARLALEDRRVSEVTASASEPLGRRAIEGAGLYARDRMPVFLRDPKSRLDGAPEVRIGSLENDFFYL